ncbi:MAG: hypothetical protein HY787_16040 [Deltaproteobacteria bacterium]|nr:hypothetical protein [Deltaproteobacteria bacterium]
MGSGSVSRAGAGAIRIGSAMGAAIKNHRVLGPAEAKIMLFLSITFLVLSAVAVIWPRLISLPAAVLGTWLAISLGIRAYKQYKKYAQDKADLPDQE